MARPSRSIRRALAGKRAGARQEHPDTLTQRQQSGRLYQAQGRYGEAEPLYQAGAGRPVSRRWARSIPIRSPASIIWPALSSQGRYGEAEPLFRRALAGQERVLGKEHPDTLASVNNLAALYFTQRDWTRAAQFWRRSTAAIAGRTQRGALDAGQPQPERKKAKPSN